MRTWQRKWAVASGVLLAVLLLAACGGASSGGGNTAAQPKKGGSITDIIQQEPDTMLPWFTSSTFAVMAQTAMWAPLYYLDADGNLNPGLATQVPSTSNGGVSADLKSITIKLKPNLKWSDGSALTSADCVFTYNLISQAASTSLGFPLASADDPIGFASASAADPQTFTVSFQHPNAGIVALFSEASSSCLPKAVYGSLPAANVAKTGQFQPTVASGPFTLKERIAGDHLTFVRNANYYQGPDKPYLDQFTMKIVTDAATTLAAFQAGSGDTSWFVDPTKIPSYKALQGYTQGLDKGAGYEWLIFNLKNPILADLQVRKALTMSVDPTTLYQPIYQGAAKATCDDQAGTFAHEENLIPCYKFDPAGAKSILDADGWTVGADGYRQKNGKTLELNYVTTTKTARKQTQQLFQAAWKDVGVKVNLQNLLSQNYFGSAGALCAGQFDIGEFASGGGIDPDDHTSFQTGQDCAHGGGNYGSYSNKAVDDAFQTELGTADVTARKAAFHTIHQAIINDLPVMYLFVAPNVWVKNNRLQNYNPIPLGDSETWNIWDWWLN